MAALHYLSLASDLNDKQSNDLWLLAAEKLDQEDRANINFSYDKLTILSDLRREAEQARTTCDEKRLTFKRKNGEKVILRDVFGKCVKWINLFKEAGDVAVSYDPGHAALPWALVRVLLQVAVSDIEKYAFVVDSLEDVSRCISRCGLLERLYVKSKAAATPSLRSSLIKTYSSILQFLSKAKTFFNSNKGTRIISSSFRDKAEFQNPLDEIRKSFDQVETWASLVSREDDVAQYRELKALLTKFDAPMVRISSSLQEIHDSLEKSKRQNILKWVSDTEALAYFKHHKESKREILEGTGQWLLKDDVYKKWKDDSASSLLWLHGIPGSGKSKLTSLVIEDGIKIAANGAGPRPAFFYCSRNPAEPLRSDPTSIMSSIARQISNLAPSTDLLPPVVQKYEMEEEIQGDSPCPLDVDEIQKLVLELVNLRPLTVIIIDALDECSRSGRHVVLDFIKSTIENASSLVKFFISSRRDEDIVFRLQYFPNLEISSTKNEADVKAFVEWETKRLITSGNLLRDSPRQHKLQDLIIKRVTADSDGMFRWASLQLQNLTTLKTDEDIIDRLGKIPPTLEELYADIYKMVTRNQGVVAQAIARNVFCVLLEHQRILRELEFRELVQVNKSQVSISQVLDICCNLVVLDKTSQVFRFAHLSVREFLLRTSDFSSIESIHSTIALCWLVRYKEPPTTSIGDFRRYTNLFYHLKRAGPHQRIENLRTPLLSFLQLANNPESPEWVPQPLSNELRCLLNACTLDCEELVEYLIGLDVDQKEPPDIGNVRSRPTFQEGWTLNIDGFIPLNISRLRELLRGNNRIYQMLARYIIFCNQPNSAESLQFLLDRQLCKVSEDLMMEALKFASMEACKTMPILLKFQGMDYVTPRVVETVVQEPLAAKDLLNRGLKFSMTQEFQQRMNPRDMWRLEFDVPATIILITSIRGFMELKHLHDAATPGGIVMRRIIGDIAAFETKALENMESYHQTIKNILDTILEKWRKTSSLGVSEYIQADKDRRVRHHTWTGRIRFDQKFHNFKLYKNITQNFLDEEVAKIDNSLKEFLTNWSESLTLIDVHVPDTLMDVAADQRPLLTQEKIRRENNGHVEIVRA
ncbi:hypothetical protein EG329_005820 [Mollisiaceae sp. DMI_Dod_QoI]|nr:hypothetical protein EG329_005820 [Helotiales sp. DMI_Dod_QoI]